MLAHLTAERKAEPSCRDISQYIGGKSGKLLTFSLFLALPLFWKLGKNSELHEANTVRAKLPSAGSAEKDLNPQSIISTLYIYNRFQTDN